MKKVINYLDNHRIILVILILFIISAIFFGYKSFIFLNHEFKAFKCEEETKNIYCTYKNNQILNKPEEISNILKKYKKDLSKLQKEYKLKDFNNYTAYQYKVVALLNYYNGGNKELYEFLEAYVNTYDLEKFYLENSFYFEIYYNYKIPSNNQDVKNNKDVADKLYPRK